MNARLWLAGLAMWLALDSVITSVCCQEYLVINTESAVYDWILEEKTGRVFASLHEENAVVEFDPTNNSELRRFEVAGSPQQMVIKGNRLVVACPGSQRLVIISLKSNQVEEPISFEGIGPYCIFCSELDDHLVYAVTSTRRQFSDTIIHQVDIERKKLLGPLNLESMRGRDSIVHAVMSAGGTAFAFDRRGKSSPSGGDVALVDAQKKQYRLITDIHDSFGVMNRSPANRFWTFGDQLFPLRSDHPIRRFSGDLVAIHPHKDLAVSYDVTNQTIAYAKFSDAEPISSLEIPELVIPKEGTRLTKKKWNYTRDIDEPSLQFDLANDRVFCGFHQTSVVIPSQELIAARDPLLLIDVPTTRIELDLESELELPVTVTNRDLLPQTNWKLASGPAGARLESGKLMFKPTATDVGQAKIVITAQHNNTVDRIEIDSNVAGAFLELNMTPRGWAISPTGRRAVVWGSEKSVANQPRSRPVVDNQGITEVVVVDLEKKAIITRQKLSKPIHQIATDDSSLYMLIRQSNVLSRIDFDDFENQQRIFLPGQGMWVGMQPDGKLLVSVADQRASNYEYVVVDPATLKLEPEDPRVGRVGYHPGTRELSGPSPINDGLIADWRFVFDRDNAEIVSIHNGLNLGLPSIGNQNNNVNVSAQIAKSWGRSHERGALKDAAGNVIGSVQTPFVISPDFAIGIGIDAGTDIRGGFGRGGNDLRIAFYNLLDGSKIASGLLFEEPKDTRNRASSHTFGFRQLKLLGEKIFVLNSDKLYFSIIDRKILEKAQTPLHLKIPRITTVDLSAPKTEIQLQHNGGDDVSFSLDNESPHVQIDSKSGLITLNTQGMWKQILIDEENQHSSYRRISARQRQNPEFANRTRQDFKIPNDKVAYAIPLNVSINNQEGQLDRLTFNLIGLGDSKQLQDVKSEALAKTMEKQRVDQQKREEMQKQLAEKQKASEDPKSLLKRIDDLETRMKRIEAMLDGVISKLEKIEKSK